MQNLRWMFQMLVNFSGVEFLRIVSKFKTKESENRCLVFTSCRKREIGSFTDVIVVQLRQRNVHKSVLQCAKLLFCYSLVSLLNKLKWRYDRRSGNCNLSNCQLTRKKIRDFNGIRIHGLCVSAAVLYQLSYKDLTPHIGSMPICWVCLSPWRELNIEWK